MKILITTDWYTPAVNGVVASVLNLRRELIARGHEVRVLTLSDSPRGREEDGVYYLGSMPAGLVYPGARIRTAPAERMVRRILDWKPDIVHSQCEFCTFPIARHIAKTLQIPMVHTYHTVYENYTHYFSPSVRWGRRAVRRFTQWVARRSDVMIAPTEKVATMLADYGVSCPISVIPTGINLEAFRKEVPEERLEEMKRELGIPQDHLVLASIGRLAEEKNIEEILTDLAKFRGRKVTLLLVGDGPVREKLEQMARNLNIEKQVVFAGMVSPKQVPEYYQLGDLFVSASTSETQGLTYLEALSSGLPALCRADRCLEGVIEQGKNGWQYENEEQFCHYLCDFLGRKSLRESMQEQAEVSSEQFGAARFAERAEVVYRNEIRRRTENSQPA